jgi:hypothetical protein
MSKHKYEPRDKHHRRCKSRQGSDDNSNISSVPQHYHRAWHLLFENLTPHNIAEIINTVWIDPRYRLVVVRSKNESHDPNV